MYFSGSIPFSLFTHIHLAASDARGPGPPFCRSPSRSLKPKITTITSHYLPYFPRSSKAWPFWLPLLPLPSPLASETGGFGHAEEGIPDASPLHSTFQPMDNTPFPLPEHPPPRVDNVTLGRPSGRRNTNLLSHSFLLANTPAPQSSVLRSQGE